MALSRNADLIIFDITFVGGNAKKIITPDAASIKAAFNNDASISPPVVNMQGNKCNNYAIFKMQIQQALST